VDLAIVSAALGQPDAAFDYLETAARERVMRLTELTMPMFDSLRNQTRFDALLTTLALQA
jgi:hypothetical protein